VYGERVKFTKGRSLKFADCELLYLGERRVSSDKFPRGFLYYDFRVTSGTETKTVSWSSGTGLIDGTDFDLAGRSYILELRGSVAYKGWLADNELVLWTRDLYEKRPREKR
jgi:hypothetical protein